MLALALGARSVGADGAASRAAWGRGAAKWLRAAARSDICEIGASKVGVLRDALPVLIKQTQIVGRTVIAVRCGPRVPDGGFGEVRPNAATTVQHDRHVELRFGHPCIRGAAIPGKGQSRIPRSVQIILDGFVEPNAGILRLRGKRQHHDQQAGQTEKGGTHRPYRQEISTLRLRASGMPGLVGTASSVSPLANTWKRSAGIPRSSKAAKTAVARFCDKREVHPRIADTVGTACHDHDDRLAFVVGPGGLVQGRFVLQTHRAAALVEQDHERRRRAGSILRGGRRLVGLRRLALLSRLCGLSLGGGAAQHRTAKKSGRA